jgi:predicted alpha/beta-hydrolase family hydrolase
MNSTSLDLTFPIGLGEISVSAILDRTEDCRSLLVLGHGSGSNMRVPFMAGLSTALVRAGVATFRYEYPYSDGDDFVPYSDTEMDDQETMLASVRSAVATAAATAPDLPLFAGGHSVSGLMMSIADAGAPMPFVHGLVILGFPLKGEFANAAHLASVPHPLLFIQGTNDALGDVAEIRRMVDSIEVEASLQFTEEADHGFSVPNRLGEDVHAELASKISAWITNTV